ncbi:GntR family transcriptional regulator [Lutimaribacter marinistellae]|uniref:GntR family transcriptional regulator n=1 Tax=Lutimaribacter marinistellae TaxID=1820329 RepID=A0ABV7THD0_9RHOB
MTAQRQGWREIRDRIHDQILSGHYAPGDKLPRDADLAKEMACARSTVQRAMQDLSDAGIIERRRKGGTRVRPDPVTRAVLDIPITRREVEAKGAQYGYQRISQATAVPPRPVLARLGLAEPRKMLRVEALHLSDGQPYMFEDRWICLETAPEIRSVDLSRNSANEWLVLNKPYSRFEVRLYAETADPRMADHLDTRPGAALFVLERTTWIEDAPITHVKAVTAPGYQMITRS